MVQSTVPSPTGTQRAPSHGRRARGIVFRILLSFAVVTVAAALVAGWGVMALREAAEQTRLVRIGYLPLTRTLRDLATLQDTWNAQLNHVTTARNPADARLWFDSALRIGRPKKFAEARAAITLAFANTQDVELRSIRTELLADLGRIERDQTQDANPVRQLFDALEQSNSREAERTRDTLVRRGILAQKRLARLDRRVLLNVDALSREVIQKERFAIRLLVGLSVGTVLMGTFLAWWIRRVLLPLESITRRARVVAGGDLTPRPVADRGDEIGELARTFEAMVTALAETKERLLATERLATIGKMAAHVTHEIRNPLSSMALNLELLEEEMSGAAPEAKSLTRAVQLELERLISLSEQYLSLARQRPILPESEDIGLLVTEALQFMRRDLEQRGIVVQMDLPKEPLIIPLDEAQLKQALFNLVRNAQEAMPSGGQLRVRVARLDQSGVVLELTDSGTGISPAVAHSLFEPFVSTKPAGTGLGLAVTRQIVQGHGGQIRWEAPTQGGSRFVIELPGMMPEGQPPKSPTVPG